MRVKLCPVASPGKTVLRLHECEIFDPSRFGSCLGPLIFLIFKHNLLKQINHCASILFADDTTLYFQTHRNLRYLKWCIEDDIAHLISWFKAKS